ncbi:MAG TPA: Stk1 family PASTA domain-containing Ser/Thr kinase [Pseudolysinimonas sp.]|nr:Stk1 family PASTA domain-containing Ser/Thr kinase [Pseudolysinimonas sp.]
MSVNTSDPMIGRLIDGRYRVRSRIARGGMATVYLATDQRLERRVAVKVMHPHLAEEGGFTERFIQEARSAARLAHPNVVNVFDQGQDGESAYLVMEYLPGITLRDLLKEYGSLTAEQTIDITEAVLAGLAAAHKSGIVHRDLKPENVLLADDGRIKIGDFGLARAASANTATGAALLGTIAYLSPELVTRGTADTRSDIYAVGIMMYEMLAGVQPFVGDQPMQIAYQHAHDEVPSPSAANPAVPAELDELVLWATAREPDDRPADATTMLDQVRDAERVLRASGPIDATTAHKTVVMPAATSRFRKQPTAETQILGRRTPPPASMPPAESAVAAGLPESTAALATASAKKRRRGWVIAAIIVALALVAGGTGWYFGVGPGAHVTIPDSLAGLTPAAATTKLQELGLEVDPKRGSTTSPTIAKDLVAETTPKLGSSIVKGSTVTLLISTGPKAIPFTLTQGMSEDEARAKIKAGTWKLAPDLPRRFNPTVPKGTVLDVLAADGTTSLLNPLAKTYPERSELTLVLSAGPLPDVAGKSFQDAVSALDAVNVTGIAGKSAYSDSVPENSVIGYETDAAAIVPGGTVKLVTSDGPAPVEVPDVVGMTWANAKAALDAAGLRYDYDHDADKVPTLVTVKSTNPDAGQQVHRGDIIKVRFTV